ELGMLVERGELDGPEVEETLQHALSPLLSQDVDVIVLGCTHFPAMRAAIERIAGSHVQIIDSGKAIAHRTHAVLEAEHTLRSVGPDRTQDGNVQVWCSGDPVAFTEVASKILGYS